MKTIFEIRMLTLLAVLMSISFFTSCNDDDSYAELRLDRAAIQIKEGSEGILKIESGSGSYQLSFSADGYATAKVWDNLIRIDALAYGKVVLNVTDASGQTVTLDVIITSKVLESDTPRFVWTKRVGLDEPNGWGLTAYENKIAVTNFKEKHQYVLTWEGDSTVGAKSGARLTVVEEGGAPSHTELAGLEILDVQDGCYSIIFSTPERTGELVFVK